MKKLIAWLSKGSKILKILKRVYRALIIADGVIGGTADGLNEAEVNNKISDKMNSTHSYLSVALKWIGTILDWFGVSAIEREAIAREALTETPEEIDAQCEREASK